VLTYFYAIEIIVAATLITLILLQTKGSGLGGIFGGSDSGIYRTRRGVEKTLFQATIVLSIVFFIFALVTVIISR